MPTPVGAVKTYATTGRIMGVLKNEFGLPGDDQRDVTVDHTTNTTRADRTRPSLTLTMVGNWLNPTTGDEVSRRYR